jgi:hypothetical protein
VPSFVMIVTLAILFCYVSYIIDYELKPFQFYDGLANPIFIIIGS